MWENDLENIRYRTDLIKSADVYGGVIKICTTFKFSVPGAAILFAVLFTPFDYDRIGFRLSHNTIHEIFTPYYGDKTLIDYVTDAVKYRFPEGINLNAHTLF